MSQVVFDLDAPAGGLHTDLPRLAAGGVGAQFWSVYVPASLAEDGAVAAVLEQIDLARRMIARYPGSFGLALTANDVEQVFASGRVASLLGAEGGHARLAGNGGVAMVTFVPGFVSQECASWTADLKAEAARRGLDPRNLDQLFSIKSEWEQAHPRPGSTLAQVADHIEHVREVAGTEHVGLGGDFDGTDEVTAGPGGRVHLPGPVRRAAPPRLDGTRLRRPGRRQPATRAALRRGLRDRSVASAAAMCLCGCRRSVASAAAAAGR